MEKITGSNYKEQLNQKGTIAIVPGGNSMWPTLKHHGQAVIIRQKAERLKKYDVALYVAPSGKYILHRVIAVKDDVYLIRGDNTYAVERVPKTSVIGVLFKFNRKGKSHTTDERLYKIYSRLWHYIYPLRFICKKVKNTLGKIYRAIFKRKKNKGASFDEGNLV